MMNKLNEIKSITGIIEIKTGLHIGGNNDEMRIGGIDNPVIKNPINQEPYIPGSSLKGKTRSLLEWEAGLPGITEGKVMSSRHLKQISGKQAEKAINILQLFGDSGDSEKNQTGLPRLSFCDCKLNLDWKSQIKDLSVTEEKVENTINRISGTALNPRHTERVVAGAKFDFKLSLKVFNDEDLLPYVLKGMKLLELDALGGSGSRGYGKIKFLELKCDDKDIQKDFEAAQAFGD